MAIETEVGTETESDIAAEAEAEAGAGAGGAGASSARGRSLDLFMISFLILFFELACIRWFGGTVIFLTFFTNLVLLACFLGMSVGLLSARRRGDLVESVLPLALLAVTLAVAAGGVRGQAGAVAAGVGGRGSPQQVYFGAESVRSGDPSRLAVPIEVVAAVFFVLIALTFVGLGQVMGRAFEATPDRLWAYTVDVLGSLTGIVAFGLVSLYRVPPVVWFTVVAVVAARFVRRMSWSQAACATALVGAVGTLGAREGAERVTTWSPYYKVQYDARIGALTTNNIGHQQMVPVGETGAAYMLPHLLNRDAGGPPFRRVLVVGAGSGNDVSAALLSGAERVDAVEIEPVLNEVGRRDHPNRPYDDPRVAVHLDDGRSFVRRSAATYDLIEYALVDSLVLHSGYSSLRLESFLFTEEALRDVKRRLDDDGVFVMSNFYRQGWVVGRLVALSEKVFGTKPVVIALPYRPAVAAGDSLVGDNFTFVVVGKPGSKALERVRASLGGGASFWLSRRPLDNQSVNGFGASPPAVAGVPAGRFQRIGAAAVDTRGVGPLPTDSWPFLYLRDAAIPALNLRGIALVAGISLAILFAFAPARSVRPNFRMFFLGAGFMLVETKGVVHLALLFGSTWVVNSVVFSAILVMILLSNLYVLAARPRSLRPYYALLLATLLLNACVPMGDFLGLPGPWKVLASCGVVFAPVFFAGVVFAATFRESRAPDVDFGSNVAGVILGGLSENASLVIGFDHLLLVAAAFYVLSAALGPRVRLPLPAAAPAG